MPESGQYIGLN